ncbi:MAG TPA: hypothetical protein VN985_07960 [Candidatus Eisenbacteria bacterium]|nr:hypothetical protein [Methylomirabilota bacterium]HXL78567.1 hypothetical protein [Candidatus Eisenbacteria bacterium]
MDIRRTRPIVMGQDGSVSLEVRLRRIHQRRRRAVMRRLLKGAFWIAGFICAATFVLALGVEVTQR